MSLKLVIDNRETKLINILQSLINDNKLYNNIKLEVKNLTLGDIVFVEEKKCASNQPETNETIEEQEILLFERKTINDLASSIRDGRYKEQSTRLNILPIHNHNIIYLVEGNVKGLQTKYNKITPDAIYSSMCSILYHKGFSLIRSFDIEESAIIIMRFFYKIQKEKDRNVYYENTVNTANTVNTVNNVDNECNYTTLVKKVKKDNITPNNIGSIILSQIPNVSNVSAIAIMDKYKTIYNLIQELDNNKDALNDMTYITNKGKKRRFNKNTIKSIYNYIMNGKNNV